MPRSARSLSDLKTSAGWILLLRILDAGRRLPGSERSPGINRMEERPCLQHGAHGSQVDRGFAGEGESVESMPENFFGGYRLGDFLSGAGF